MAHINVDLNAVDDSQVHDEGMTHVRVTGSETKKKKDEESGPGYINWTLTPVNTKLKRPLYLITTLKPESLAGLKQFLKACGFQWGNMGDFATEDVHGSELMVNVGIEKNPQTDEDRNVVKFPYQKVRL